MKELIGVLFLAIYLFIILRFFWLVLEGLFSNKGMPHYKNPPPPPPKKINMYQARRYIRIIKRKEVFFNDKPNTNIR